MTGVAAPGRSCSTENDASPFPPGAVVLVTLGNPREKFWGALLELSTAGMSLRGMELNSLDDFAAQLKAGEAVRPGVFFFPMHRLERMELDARSGLIPSLAEQFHAKSGQSAAQVLTTPAYDQAANTPAPSTAQAPGAAFSDPVKAARGGAP